MAQRHFRQRWCFVFKEGFFLMDLADHFLNPHTFHNVPSKEFLSFPRCWGKSCLLLFVLSLLLDVFFSVSQALCWRVNNSSLLTVARVPPISTTSHLSHLFQFEKSFSIESCSMQQPFKALDHSCHAAGPNVDACKDHLNQGFLFRSLSTHNFEEQITWKNRAVDI